MQSGQNPCKTCPDTSWISGSSLLYDIPGSWCNGIHGHVRNQIATLTLDLGNVHVLDSICIESTLNYASPWQEGPRGLVRSQKNFCLWMDTPLSWPGGQNSRHLAKSSWGSVKVDSHPCLSFAESNSFPVGPWHY